MARQFWMVAMVVVACVVLGAVSKVMWGWSGAGVAGVATGVARGSLAAAGDSYVSGIAGARAGATVERVGEDGFGAFVPSEQTQFVYVSAEGDDQADGRLAETAVRTPDRGYQLLRDGQPDWLLFRAGDTFEGGLSYWGKSGLSVEEPMVVGVYGEGARPRFKTNGQSFINVYHKTLVRHVAFVGLHLYANHRDPASPEFDGGRSTETGVRWLVSSEDILFEDCLIEFFEFGMIFQPYEQPGEYPQRNTTIRRCIIRESYCPWDVGQSSGLYVLENENLAVVQCVFDRNGHNDAVEKADRTIFNHNVYMNQCRNVRFEGNISSRAGNFGLKIRSDVTGRFTGLVIRENLFYANTNAITVGGNKDKRTGEYQPYSTQQLVIAGNVFLGMGGVLYSSGLPTPQSYGIIMNTVADACVEENLFLDKPAFGSSCAIKLEAGLPQRNVMLRRNVVHGWEQGTITEAGEQVAWEGNVLATDGVRFADGERSGRTYLRSVGREGEVEDLIALARSRPRGQWDEALSAAAVCRYLREGFVAR